MKEKVLLLFSAMRDTRTPWYAKVLLGLVVAYIISPIDIIPDFIPVIGMLDEIVLVPIALALIYKLIPESVIEDKKYTKIDDVSKKKLMLLGIFLVILTWGLLLYLVLLFHPF